jgi:hypothetical protein
MPPTLKYLFRTANTMMGGRSMTTSGSDTVIPDLRKVRVEEGPAHGGEARSMPLGALPLLAS